MRTYRLGVRHSAGVCALVATVVLGVPDRAFAQESTPSASDTALARQLGSEGVQLADSGNCAAAIEKLERAEKLYHAPPLLGRLGECQVQVGKIVAGTENLQRVVREQLAPKAPKAFVDAQARAQKALDSALPKLAKLKIHVEAPPGTNLTVTQDGEPVSSGALDLDRPADPGPHKVEASAPGFRPARGETTLAEGSSGQISLRLEPDPNAPVGAATPPSTTGAPPYPGPGAGQPGAPGYTASPGAPVGAEVSSGGGSNVPAFIMLGVGVAGLAVGSIFGAQVLSKKSALDEVCKNGKERCPSTSQADIDSMNTASTISTVGFAAGGVGVAVGVILLIAHKSSSSADAKTAPAHATFTPFVGPTSVGLSGSF
ncbi:MAG: hypothetical protein ABW133_08140 [Polyangiaceae bacterium]